MIMHTVLAGLSFNFRLGKSTVCEVLNETCAALWSVPSKDYVKAPSLVEEWKELSHEFWTQWNFSNCIGTIRSMQSAVVVITCSLTCIQLIVSTSLYKLKKGDQCTSTIRIHS